MFCCSPHEKIAKYLNNFEILVKIVFVSFTDWNPEWERAADDLTWERVNFTKLIRCVVTAGCV